jgi:hypothetical protein
MAEGFAQRATQNKDHFVDQYCVILWYWPFVGFVGLKLPKILYIAKAE